MANQTHLREFNVPRVIQGIEIIIMCLPIYMLMSEVRVPPDFLGVFLGTVLCVGIFLIFQAFGREETTE